MMSEFLAARYAGMSPYVPGEQPKDRPYVKLNANETSVPPCPGVAKALADPQLAAGLGRYADPHCMPLREAVARTYGVTAAEVFCGNGSDEVLGLLLLTFCEPGARIAFPDVTYGFYRDFSATHGLAWTELPLRDDFALDVEAFAAFDGTVVFPNPNAPTGLAITRGDVARICEAHPNRLVIVDEAYVDYGSQTCVPLTRDHRNLVIVHTMSKSRNLAGAHIGWCIAQPDLIDDLNDIKFSFNPFNLSAPTMAIGIAALEDEGYFQTCTSTICETRDHTSLALEGLGFTVLPSKANFICARHPMVRAADLCARLRTAGVLTRHYDAPRIDGWLRVTVGTPQEMALFLAETERILQGRAPASP
ncbi:MAG: histidinol-phosphate transaminase [Acidobacteriota bacterium]|nr:histidinol-phosphate transaminase [Acidobacteriota bacterium]